MKYKLRFLDTVDSDITAIAEYLEEQLVPLSLVLTPIFDQIEKDLPLSPFIYPEYPDDQRFRKMVLDKHIVFYVVDEDKEIVEIHHILHEKRNIRKFLQTKKAEK